MYHLITTPPSEDHVKVYGMHVTQEDAYVDYRVVLEVLTPGQRRGLETVYGLPEARLEGEAILILTVSSGV